MIKIHVLYIYRSTPGFYSLTEGNRFSKYAFLYKYVSSASTFLCILDFFLSLASISSSSSLSYTFASST